MTETVQQLAFPFSPPDPRPPSGRRRPKPKSCGGQIGSVQLWLWEREVRRAIRSPKLHQYAARRQRQGARPRSAGSGPLTRIEREELATIERAFAFEGDAGWSLPATMPRACGGEIAMFGPCPYTLCRHHNHVEELRVSDDENVPPVVKLNFPETDLAERPPVVTCSLAVAADGEEHTLEEVGQVLNLTQERVRTIEDAALAKIAALDPELAEAFRFRKRLKVRPARSAGAAVDGRVAGLKGRR